MKRFASACLALVSACTAAVALCADRPHYGGTLRVEMAATVRSLDPAAPASDPAEAAARARMLPLVFETLTRIDDGLRPGLAVSWESNERRTRWQFKLRPGVVLHDGSTLDLFRAAAALRNVDARWTASPIEPDTIVIESPEPVPDLPWRVAEHTRAIVVRPAAGRFLGTGPFRIERIEPDTLTLRANEDYREGRPFLDGVQVKMGRPAAAQLSDLEAGRADLVAIQATDVRRATQRGMRIGASSPIELVALVFEPHRSGDELAPLRRAVSSMINRATLCDVLLQQQATPASALLPAWLSGFAGSLQSGRPPLSRSALEALPPDQREIVVRVDASDPLLRDLAERVAVDAREGGLSIKVQAPTGLAPRPDARLVRVRASATTPERAFAALVERLGPRIVPDAALIQSPEAVYRAEAALLDRSIVIPIVHAKEIYAAAEHVAFGSRRPIEPSGAWDFADLSLRTVRP